VDREKALEAIADQARHARPKASRATWIAAGLVVVASVIACAIILFADGASTAKPPGAVTNGAGFTTGLAVGLAVGLALGVIVARRKDR
jgi:hypothetical protein